MQTASGFSLWIFLDKLGGKFTQIKMRETHPTRLNPCCWLIKWSSVFYSKERWWNWNWTCVQVHSLNCDGATEALQSWFLSQKHYMVLSLSSNMETNGNVTIWTSSTPLLWAHINSRLICMETMHWWIQCWDRFWDAKVWCLLLISAFAFFYFYSWFQELVILKSKEMNKPAYYLIY